MNPHGGPAFDQRRRSAQKPVFLSSLSTGLHRLRARLAGELADVLWVAETDDESLVDFEGLLRVDACIDCLRQSKLLICLLGGDGTGENHWGTTIPVEGVLTVASYFEVEVIHAILNRIPVIVLVRDDYRPAPRLGEFVGLLKEVGVGVLWREGLSDGEIENAVRHSVSDLQRWAAEGAAISRSFARLLAEEIGRSHPRSKNLREILPETRWFLGRRITGSNGRQGDLARARRLLAFAQSSEGHDKRLTRLYLAASELMLLSTPESAEGEELVLWLEILEIWGGAAAWFGIHNHLGMGVISTLASQAVLRGRLAESMPDQARRGLIEGAFASAYYSFGKQCPDKADKRRVLKVAEEFAGIVADHGGDPGIYVVRACIHAELGKRLALFVDLLRLVWFALVSRKVGMRAECLAVLGKALSQAPFTAVGILLLRKAVMLHRREYESKRTGPEFVVKAYKHLIYALRKSGRRINANEALSTALALARNSGIDDQIRQLEQLEESGFEL